MKVIAIYKNILFISPFYAGGNITECVAKDLDEFESDLICQTYKDAHKKAFLTLMDEWDYKFNFHD